jgi:hypothetical protein
MTDLYNKTSERLWEKLEWYRNEIDTSCVDFSQPFPIDQLTKGNSLVRKLIEEVQKEFKYYMSEFQCSWATVQFIKGGIEMMKQYNEKNRTNLVPKK